MFKLEKLREPNEHRHLPMHLQSRWWSGSLPQFNLHFIAELLWKFYQNSLITWWVMFLTDEQTDKLMAEKNITSLAEVINLPAI